MTKALISVTGLDATGIIARIATRLYEMNINILDITQTILGGYFTMMMVVIWTEPIWTLRRLTVSCSRCGMS